MKYRSIKCYLSALRHAQIANGFLDPQFVQSYPRLEYLLRGIRRSQAESLVQSCTRLQITPEVLLSIHSHLPSSKDSAMIWASCCIGLFGFLRSGEFTVPSLSDYDPSVHLSLSDVAVYLHSNSSILRHHLTQSKTDPFRVGVDIFMGRLQHPFLCPLVAMTRYLRTRGSDLGPLFRFVRSSSGRSKHALLELASNMTSTSGHSFRIVVATTAARVGLDDSLIQTLGRWQSTAYLRYIKLPRASLTAVSSVLVQ